MVFLWFSYGFAHLPVPSICTNLGHQIFEGWHQERNGPSRGGPGRNGEKDLFDLWFCLANRYRKWLFFFCLLIYRYLLCVHMYIYIYVLIYIYIYYVYICIYIYI